MEPLWLPPCPPCPLLSVLSDSGLEAVLGFLSSWRVTSVHLWDEKMTIFLAVFHPTLFSGERLGEEGNYYMRGERGPGDATASPARSVGEEEDLDPKLDGEKPEISGNGWEWPKKNFRRPLHHPHPVLSCPKVFPIMVSVCKKVHFSGGGGSLKAHRPRQACVKAWIHRNHPWEQAQRCTYILSPQ